MSHMRLRQLAETSYPAVQLAMAPQYRGLRDDEIESLLAEHFPGATPEDVENFMKTLRKVGKVAAPIAQKALPGVIQGASAGMVAGPWGAVAGGLIGGTASVLAGSGQKSTQSRPGASAPAARPAPQPAARPAPAPAAAPVPSAPPSAAPILPMVPSALPMRSQPVGAQDPVVAAAARVILVISRPEVQQALLALLMGRLGRQSVSLAEQTMPVAAIADTLAEMASELADAVQNGSSTSWAAEWAADMHGASLIDTTNPAERAGLVLANLLADAVPAPQEPPVLEDVDKDEDDDWDALEAYETWMETD